MKHGPRRTLQLLVTLAALPLASATAQMQDQLEVDWQFSAVDYRGQFRSALNVYCPPGGPSATVWGAGMYTDDSSICWAAVHALATFDVARGGTVYFAMEPGQEGYDQDRRHGVTTQSYNAWGGSFRIVAGVPGKRQREINASTPAEITWFTTAKHLRGRVTANRVLLCPRDGEMQPVWGSGMYNDDSSICAAAVHAGLITRVGGGGISVRAEPGREGYVGTTKNSVTSLPWEKGDGSFQFPSGQVAVALPPPSLVAEAPQPERTPLVPPAAVAFERSNRAPSGEFLINWNTTASEWRQNTGELISVYCPPGGSTRTVWGSDVYTDDSSVCTAAVHALATFSNVQGGTVHIAMLPAQDSYPARQRRGVSTSEWGAWESSFRVVAGVPGKRMSEIIPTTVVELNWSSTAEHLRGKNGVYRVVCPREGRAYQVFGSTVYSDNSSVCSAGVHAGLIAGAEGGAITLRIEAGRLSYAGSTQNGTTTQSLGNWKGSFSFSR